MYLYMISVNVIYCNFFQYIISVCFSLMLPLFLSIERQDSPYFLCILPFPFPFSSEVRSQNKSQNLPSVFYIFIFLTFFFLFGHSSKPSFFCTSLYRAYSQTHTIIHAHAHTRTRFLPILHTYNTFFRLHYLSYILSLSLSLSFSYSFLILLSLSYFIYLFRSKKSEQ